MWSTDSTIALLLGVLIGIPQLIVSVMAWWEARIARLSRVAATNGDADMLFEALLIRYPGGRQHEHTSAVQEVVEDPQLTLPRSMSGADSLTASERGAVEGHPSERLCTADLVEYNYHHLELTSLSCANAISATMLEERHRLRSSDAICEQGLRAAGGVAIVNPLMTAVPEIQSSYLPS